MSEASDLPSSWTVAQLEEVAKWGSGGTPSRGNPKFYNGKIPWIKTGELGSKYVFRTGEHITEEAVKKSSAKLFPKGSVGIAMYGATIGKTSIFGIEASTNQACAVAICNDSVIHNEYLYYFLVSQQRSFVEAGKGGAQPNISQGVLKEWYIPYAPLNEQKRIVEKIEELFSQLDKGIESLKAAREQLKNYRRTLLKKLFDDEALKPKPLSEFVLDMGQGWSPKCFETPSPSNEIWGVIRTTAIQHLHFDESANKELPASLPPREHLEIQENDILITRAGPRNRVGVACLVKKVRPKLILCDKAYRIKADEDQIIPEFLIAILNTPRAQKEIEELKSGISDSGLNLTQKRFLELEVRVPDIKVQQQLLDGFELQIDQIREAERTVEQQLISVEALRQSILKAAFSGKLVPQDPNDEPASVLLERIRSDQGNTLARRGTKK